MRAPNGEMLPADPFEWRPQEPRPARRTPPVRDPIVEPLWSGVRVLAHFELRQPASNDGHAAPWGHVRLVDAYGDDLALNEPELLREIGDSILAMDAIIDGVLTRQATRGGEGAAILHEAHVSSMGMLLSRDAGIEVGAPAARSGTPIAFVALDLLRLDGQPLLDLPLLERKRQLEGIIRSSERVRISPFTRPPVDPWVASWQGAGFRGAMLKEANGRYSPGSLARDWVVVTRLRQR